MLNCWCGISRLKGSDYECGVGFIHSYEPEQLLFFKVGWIL